MMRLQCMLEERNGELVNNMNSDFNMISITLIHCKTRHFCCRQIQL